MERYTVNCSKGEAVEAYRNALKIEENEERGILPLVDWFIALETKSEANMHEHWSKRYKRAKRHCKIIWAKWKQVNPEVSLPCTVILTRLGVRELDEDNLAYCFKAIRDQVADLIIPGLPKGKADGDKRIKWVYKQVKQPIAGIKITIYTGI